MEHVRSGTQGCFVFSLFVFISSGRMAWRRQPGHDLMEMQMMVMVMKRWMDWCITGAPISASKMPPLYLHISRTRLPRTRTRKWQWRLAAVTNGPVYQAEPGAGTLTKSNETPHLYIQYHSRYHKL